MPGRRHQTNQKSDLENPIMLFCSYDSKSIVHKELFSKGQSVNVVFYLGVLRRLVYRVCRMRLGYHGEGSWRLMGDNALTHRSTENRALTINDSLDSPDLTSCYFHIFGFTKKNCCYIFKKSYLERTQYIKISQKGNFSYYLIQCQF